MTVCPLKKDNLASPCEDVAVLRAVAAQPLGAGTVL